MAVPGSVVESRAWEPQPWPGAPPATFYCKGAVWSDDAGYEAKTHLLRGGFCKRNPRSQEDILCAPCRRWVTVGWNHQSVWMRKLAQYAEHLPALNKLDSDMWQAKDWYAHWQRTQSLKRDAQSVGMSWRQFKKQRTHWHGHTSGNWQQKAWGWDGDSDGQRDAHGQAGQAAASSIEGPSGERPSGRGMLQKKASSTWAAGQRFAAFGTGRGNH